MGVRAKPGDLFLIPLEDKVHGVGVVAAKWKSELYLVVFSETVADAGALVDLGVETLTPLFATSSLDAKLWHRHWPIVKRCESLGGIQQPIYKVQESSGWVAESFDRSFRVAVGEDVAAELRFRKCVAPIRIERGLKAHAGDGDWLPAYDDLLYREVLKSREVVPVPPKNSSGTNVE